MEELKTATDWVKMVFPELSDEEAVEKAKFWLAMVKATSADLATFKPDPRITHANDARQSKPL